jgi:predicted phosphodiesterase
VVSPIPEPTRTEPLLAHTRIGVVGDIHTEAGILAWALGVLRDQGATQLLATGDIADGPLNSDGVIECCRLLREHNVLTVLGNHDRWMLDSDQRDFPDATFVDELDQATRDYLSSLPSHIEIITPLGLMLFGHGLGADDMATFYPSDHGPALSENAPLQVLLHSQRYQLVLSGHTHRRMVRKLGGITFINAGAIKATREPCCLVLDFRERRARFFDYAAEGGTKPGPEFEL